MNTPESHTRSLTAHIKGGIGGGFIFIVIEVLLAIQLTATAERAGLSSVVRMDVLFLAIFLIMAGGSYLAGRLLGLSIKAYLRPYLNEQGLLANTPATKWTLRSVTWLPLGVFGLASFAQMACERVHVVVVPVVLSQVRDCYVFTNSIQSLLHGCCVGLLLTVFWEVRSLEKQCGYRVQIQTPTTTGWSGVNVAVVMGLIFVIAYGFYKTFTLGR